MFTHLIVVLLILYSKIELINHKSIDISSYCDIIIHQ